METDLRRLLEKLNDNIGRIDVTLASQHATLTEHIRRTALNEIRLEKIESELQPLKRAHFMWAGAGKLLAAIGVTAAMIEAVFRIAGHFL